MTSEFLEEVSGDVPSKLMTALWAAISAKDNNALSKSIDEIMLEGLSAKKCIVEIHDRVLGDDQIPDAQKAAICEALAAAESNIQDGADDQLQLHGACSTIVQALSV